MALRYATNGQQNWLRKPGYRYGQTVSGPIVPVYRLSLLRRVALKWRSV